MKIKYKITESILNNSYSFANLHGRLYSIPSTHRWIQTLKKKVERKAGEAATKIDKYISESTLKEDDTKQKQEFEHYTNAKREIRRIFNSYDKLSITMIREIASIIHGKRIKALRRNKKALPKIVKTNNTYKTVQLNIKTLPDEINNSLIKYFRWLKGSIFEINPILLAGISHLKLVEIHPLEDGNGRLARIFEHGLLYLNKVDPNNIIPIEDFYYQTKERYYAELDKNIQSRDITDWLEYYCEGLNYSVNTSAKILKDISGGTIDILNNKYTELTNKEMDVVELITHNNQSSGAEIARKLKVTRQNINSILKRLIEKDVVKKLGKGSSTRYTTKD